MATSDDLFRLQAHLPGLARAIFAAADAQFPAGAWSAVVLNVRYFADGSGSLSKVRVELPGGGVESIKFPAEAAHTLRELGDARAEGKDRWYGLRLRVTGAGECETAFDDDPHCAEDDVFFDT